MVDKESASDNVTADAPNPDIKAETVSAADAETATTEASVPPPGDVAALTALLEDARGKADEHWNQLLRLQAEQENLKKRNARELENAHKFALEKFALALLPVKDSMEMGISATSDTVDPAKLREGMELTLKLLTDTLEKFQIKAVDPQGERFDPELHQAMAMQADDSVAANTVINVMQKGYTLNDRLIRPAMVIVSKVGGEGKVTEFTDTNPNSGGNVDEKA